MAPPPPASLPLQQRIIALAQTLQFAWFAGHLTLIICLFRYSLAWVRFNSHSTGAVFAYRTSFVAAALTYGIVVYKTLRARSKANKLPANAAAAVGLIGDENVQYLLLALVWLFSPQYPLALLPYAIYSVFHVATYTRANLLPTFFPGKQLPAAAGASPNAKPQYSQHPLADSIGAFVKEYYDASMSIVSGLEIALWLRLLFGALLFTKSAWILLAVYTAFLRARFSQSVHVQNSFGALETRVDGLVGGQGTPPAAKGVWDGVKNGARQFHAATDVSKYMNGASAPKKTS